MVKPNTSGKRKPDHQTQLRPQNAPSSSTDEFQDGYAIKIGLSNTNPEALKMTLIKLKNQLMIKGVADVVLSNDSRVLLVKDWLERSPAAKELFEIWDGSSQQNTASASFIITILASILALLDTHFIHHPLGVPIMKAMLSGNYLRRLNSYIGGNQTELILASLKLFNAMSQFADGRDKRAICDGFSWGLKSLPRLLTMRRKGDFLKEDDPFCKPDIRALYISFILSFLTSSTPTPIKLGLLDHKDVLSSVFKDISRDHFLVIRRVLETCWEGLWNDQKIRRTIKVAVFGEWTLQQIGKLYARSEPEGLPDRVPADLAHHFLLAICTRPGVGVCFKDHGWYLKPLEDDVEDVEEGVKKKKSRIYNRILGNFIQSLHVTDDTRQQELALKVLEACPELMNEYWRGCGISLEPRLSSRWITNVAYAGAVVSLPIPMTSVLLPSGQYNPTPPPVSSIVASVIPPSFTRTFGSKGLQSPSRLVRHLTSLLLAKSLRKLSKILGLFRRVEECLEEGEEGVWGSRRRELVGDVGRRFPDFQVVLALLQRPRSTTGKGKNTSTEIEDTSAMAESGNDSLTREATLRLLWSYHEGLPDLVAETRFDVGKLLLSVVETKDPGHSTAWLGSSHGSQGLMVLSQLHVLRLLENNVHFQWSSKLGHTSQSALYHILHLHSSTSRAAVRQVSAEVVRRLLCQSVLFEHDPAEVEIWLQSLPSSVRPETCSAPDGTRLTDEIQGFLTFLDDCLQRCLKTPYRYLEESLGVFSLIEERGPPPSSDSFASAYNPTTAPSPLLFTCLEQYRAKISGRLLSPPDALAIATFFRKFTLDLVGKQPDLRYGLHISKLLSNIFLVNPVYIEHPFLLHGINREMKILEDSLSFHQEVPTQDVEARKAVSGFLKDVEAMSEDLVRDRSVELVDWLRLVNVTLKGGDVLQLARVIIRSKASISVLLEFLYQIRVGKHLWKVLLTSDLEEGLLTRANFTWCFINSGPSELSDTRCRQLLGHQLLSTSKSAQRRHIQLILHRMQFCRAQSETNIMLGCLSLFSSVLRQADHPSERDALKIQVFSSSLMQELCRSEVSSIPEITELIAIGLCPTSREDQQLVSDICLYWEMRTRVEPSEENLLHSQLWIKFMTMEQIIAFLDLARTQTPDDDKIMSKNIVEEALASLRVNYPESTNSALLPRLPGLLQIRNQFSSASTIHSELVDVFTQAIPLGCDDRPIPISSLLAHATYEAEKKWGQRSNRPLPDIALYIFDSMRSDDEDVVRMATAMMYRDNKSQGDAARFLATGPGTQMSIVKLLPLIHAMLDVDNQHVDNWSALGPLSARCTDMCALLFDPSIGRTERSLAARSVGLLIKKDLQGTSNYKEALLLSVEAAPSSAMLETEISALSLILVKHGLLDVATAIVESGLRWVVRRFAEDPVDSTDFLFCLGKFDQVLGHLPDVKAHIAEPVLTAAIQNRLKSMEAMTFAANLVQRVKMKPVNVNRILQNVLQQPSFLSCASSNHPSSPRNAIVHFLFELFNMHPNNTFQPSHITPLIRIYKGTQSIADRRLLSLFHLFERHRKLSIASLLTQWSSQSGSNSNGGYEAVISFDPTVMLHTYVAFPQHRSLSSQGNYVKGLRDDLYDPAFAAFLLGLCLREGVVRSGIAWVEIFRTNVVSLCISSLSSKDVRMRALGRTTLAGVYGLVKNVAFQERDHARYILNMVKCALGPPKDDTSVPRLPTYTALLLAHALRCVFNPSDLLFPIISRFLLQRPSIDQRDVPLLYGMLYSSSEDSKTERTWILRFLADGMSASVDWRVLKRRHTWDLLASMFSASEQDRTGRRLILAVLLKISANKEAATSATLRSGLLTWMEMQMSTLLDGEASLWLRIMDNLALLFDHERLDNATLGGWRGSVLRCLDRIIEKRGSIESLFIAARVFLRLTITSKSQPPSSLGISSGLVSWLKLTESNIKLPHASTFTSNTENLVALNPPHLTPDTPDLPASHPLIWCECVRTLWQAVMGHDHRSREELDVWDALSCRTLICRYIAPSGVMSELEEWVRNETISSLSV